MNASVSLVNTRPALNASCKPTGFCAPIEQEVVQNLDFLITEEIREIVDGISRERPEVDWPGPESLALPRIL
jgi:hypothetical protein